MKPRRWALPAAACYAMLVALTWTFEGHAAQKLQPRGMDGFGELRQPARRPGPPSSSGSKVPFSSIKRLPGGYALKYGFRNFNGDAASIQAELNSETVAQSIKEYGIRSEDFKALDDWYRKAQQAAIDDAESRYFKGKVSAPTREALDDKLQWIAELNKKIKDELDRKLTVLSKDYRRKRVEVYTKAGFRFQKEGVVEADIPAMAKRNWRRVRSVAKAFSELGEEKDYDAEDLVGGVTAMVQTALRYEIPDSKEGSRIIGGAMPPPQTLVLGQGDCDTKTALIASILLNWPNVKMVGLGIPGHYLMAYHRIPRRGDVFIEYEGLTYVMIESAGPAWLPPGKVGDNTQDYLDSGQDFRIQPITL
ncbi:MAG: hypothetical protein HYZ75_05140 [Elusimicrobia bacterium]|nr:hypothetical protein [Elusimicrobiota bacterium]